MADLIAYLSSVFSDVSAFFTGIFQFIDQSIYSYAQEVLASWIISYTIASIKFKLAMVVFAWGVAQSILDQLNITSTLSAYWQSLDSKLLDLLTFLQIPTAIQIILSARVTRFVLGFLGL